MNDRATGYPDCITPEQHKIFSDFKTALSRRFSSPTYDDVPLSLWNISIPRRTSKGDLSTAQTALLLKFLRASSWNVNEASTKISAMLKWRLEYKIENLMKEKFSEELTKACYVYGVDRRSNPIIYVNLKEMANLSLLSDMEKFVRWRISILEKALSKADFENGGEKVTFLFDWTGCGFFMESRVNESHKKLFGIIRSYYPECVDFKISVNVSPLKEICNDILSIISPSRKKDIMVSPPKVQKLLLGLISPDSIAPQFGGFEPLPEGVPSEVQMILIGATKSASSEIPAEKGQQVHFSYICREGDVTGSFGFKKEGKRFLDDKNQIGKKESGKGVYEVGKSGAFVISFANEDPVGEKTVFFRLAVLSKDDLKNTTEKKKSKKKKGEKSSPTSPETPAITIEIDEAE